MKIEITDTLPPDAFSYKDQTGKLRQALSNMKVGQWVKVSAFGSIQAQRQRVHYHNKVTGQKFETSKGDGCIWIRRAK